LNVLFLTLENMENINNKGIYTDLVRELARREINMYVVSPRERRKGLPTELATFENIKLLKVKTGNITQTNFLEKGISTISIEGQFLKAIQKYFKDIRFDFVMYSTPPITFEKVITYLKRKHNCKTYLVLKDIFPQNAVDLEMMKAGSFIWKFFRNKEKKLYHISDTIGCMSNGNVQYILNHNPFLKKENVEVFPNAIEPLDKKVKVDLSRGILEKYLIPKESTLFIYGGNLGKPQGIEFLKKVAENFFKVQDGHLLIIGSGTEYEDIKNHLNTLHVTNVSLYPLLPKKEYDRLLEIADVGLIFLDSRFTIPNFPSRITAYMEHSLPVLAATDLNTDLKDMLQQSKSGLWSESGDIETIIENANRLSADRAFRQHLGENGRKYLEEHYDIRKTVNIILKHL